jgi:DNA polymerase-1
MLVIVSIRGTLPGVVPAPLLVFDAPSLLYRAFYALPDTITEPAEKRPVNALLGATNLVLYEWEVHGPRAIVACFGPDAAPYRTELYAAYHADRPEMPEGLVWQWGQAREFWDAFGWTVARSEEVEADDLLGSYAQAEVDAGGEALILTGDRDMYQCVGEHVRMLYVKTGQGRGAEEVDADEVVTRYGIPPELVPDFIALRGDPSDGLPGGKGIGPKTAAELLQEYGSLEGAISAAQKVTGPLRPRVGAALRDQADELRAFREIALLRTVAVEPPPSAPVDGASAAAAARSLGMNRLAERVEKL